MTHDVAARRRVAGLQPVQVIAALVALVYLVVGIVGFTKTGVSNWSADNMVLLVGFMLTPLHNLVHLAVGVVGALFALSGPSARLFGWLLFIAFGALTLWGLAVQGVFSSNPVSGLGDPLRLTVADNWLHLGTAVVGLVLAFLPARRKVVVAELPEEDVQPVEQPAHTAADDGVPVTEDAAAEEGGKHSWSRRRKDPTRL